MCPVLFVPAFGAVYVSRAGSVGRYRVVGGRYVCLPTAADVRRQAEGNKNSGLCFRRRTAKSGGAFVDQSRAHIQSPTVCDYNTDLTSGIWCRIFIKVTRNSG